MTPLTAFSATGIGTHPINLAAMGLAALLHLPPYPNFVAFRFAAGVGIARPCRMPPPRRVPLPHAPPDFVPAGAVFFLTVCTIPRGENQLARPEAWAGIQAAAAHYHAIGRWHIRLLLAMPDHVHALASFPATETMARVVAAWKHFIGCRLGLVWQRDFFDHRLRSAASLAEKARYIRHNPVRAGLVSRPEEWPYVWSPDPIPPVGR